MTRQLKFSLMRIDPDQGPKHEQMLIVGAFVGSDRRSEIRAPYDGQVVGSVPNGDWQSADAALEAASEAFKSWRKSTPETRTALLKRISELVREREAVLVDVLTREVGKPLKWSQGEVNRLALTFDLAASLTDREPLPVDLDYDPRGKDFEAEVRRYPIGVIVGIVPYNWPLNLAAHKLAPALATGNTIVLKPSNQAPISTLMLVRLIHEAGCPPGVVNAVVVHSNISERMALDERVAMLSFTGSPAVGWELKRKLVHKKVTLELGGDASVIVHSDADLDWAVERIVWGKYGYAGQICISVQHVLCQARVYERFREKLVRAVIQCPSGDPCDPITVCGPLISSDAADKVQSWIAEAELLGAKLLAGGRRTGNLIEPTLLEDVPPSSHLGCQEAFGPVLTLSSYDEPAEAIGRVNKSQYGIHCGLFTHDPAFISRASEDLEVGGVVINDVPTIRFDALPYGGVKLSGFGREGVRYAMEEMTEPKSIVIRTL
jgi:acyl-CoA reductase-like NAD-dependent aldehyde dehydrogenase